MKKPITTHGFTLVELSIVLVILGLLVGGVLTGQSLIHAATLRKEITSVDQVKTAINTFKGKYLAMPGDMPNATAFWPNESCDGGAHTGNCFGNGNGIIDGGNEIMYIWKHLSLAGLIPGTYSGNWHPGLKPGVDMPQSALGGSMGWYLSYFTQTVPNAGGYYDHIGNGHYIQTGSYTNPAGYYGDPPPILAEDLYNIDMKVDDGKALTGTVMTWNHPACTDSSGNYNLSGGNPTCYLFHSVD